MRIVLAGGGTGGPTFPLLAVATELLKLKKDVEFLFIGTKSGPEMALAEKSGIKFKSISSGKLRRYFSLRNLSDLARIWAGFWQARKILKDFHPDAVLTAGSFVGVPVAFAAWQLGIKIFVHQQDAKIGLANKIISPIATYITTAFEPTSKEFYSGSGFERIPKIKTEWIGNPIRAEFFPKKTPDSDYFGLNSDLPVLLIFGGATGALQINEATKEALPKLLKSHQIIHVTGKGNLNPFPDPNYHPFEFLEEGMPDALKLADLVVARAGLSTIAELSALGKISIIVPLPNSHQEDNALILKKANAAVVLDKDEFTPETLERVVTSLKYNQKRRNLISKNIKSLMPHDSATKLAKIMLKMIEEAK